MALYQELKRGEALARLVPLLKKGWGRVDTETGLIHLDFVMDADSPWIHSHREGSRGCFFYHRILFGIYGLLPIRCLECWKVVVRPKSLTGLFELLELQRSSGRSSKCGIETRETVPALYGGYFYNDSLDQGAECLQYVYEAIRSSIRYSTLRAETVDRLGPDGRPSGLILKRGCTEFEHKFGSSNQWKVPETQRETEQVIRSLFGDLIDSREQTEVVVERIQRRWIEWAWAHGDESYAQYTGGQPLYPTVTKYYPNEPPWAVDENTSSLGDPSEDQLSAA